MSSDTNLHLYEGPSAVRALLDERRERFVRRLRSQGLSDFPQASSALAGSAVLLSEQTGALALSYGQDAPEPEVDEKEMTASFTVTTPRKDRYGDEVVPRGCVKTLDNYRKNPVVFFGHKSYDLPIATCSELDVGEDRIRATFKFHGQTAESACVFGLVNKGILKSTSIGFLPIKAAIIGSNKSEDEETEERLKRRKEKTDDGEKVISFDPWFPLRFLEWELLEISVVSLPANPDCTNSLSKYLESGQIEGEKIPPSLRKALEPFALKARVWSPGFDPEKVKYSGTLKMGASELEYKEGKLHRVDAVSLVSETDKKDAPLTDPNASTLEPSTMDDDKPKKNPMEDTLKELAAKLETVHCCCKDLAGSLADHKAMAESRHDSILKCHKDLMEKCDDMHKCLCSIQDAQPAKAVIDPQKAVEEARLMEQLAGLVKDLKARYLSLAENFFHLTGKRV